MKNIDQKDKYLVLIVFLCAMLFLTACRSHTVFLHDNNLIRLSHDNKAEVVLKRDVDAVLGLEGLGAGFSTGTGYATPTLIWSDSVTDKTCEIFLNTQTPRKLTPNDVANVPGLPPVSSTQPYCYGYISGNANLSTIAAAIQFGSSEGAKWPVLVIKTNNSWISPAYPGKGTAAVNDTAVNELGDKVAFTVGRNSKIYDVTTQQVSDCIPGSSVAFGKLNNLPAIATTSFLDNSIRFAYVSACQNEVRSALIPGANFRIYSMDWKESMDSVVYIKQTGDEFSINEYKVKTGTHTEIISDIREKTTISTY